MKKNITYFLILLISLFIFIIFYKSLNKSSFYTPNEILNKKIINFKSKDLLSKKEINFNDLTKEKKFTVLNIWSSWCVPCRSEHKYLMQLSEKKNINLIGLNYKDKETNAKKFLLDFGNPFSNILIDIDGTTSIELGAFGVPETFIINNEKQNIVKKYIGPLNEKKVNEVINITK